MVAVRREPLLVAAALVVAFVIGIVTAPYGWTGTGYGRLPEFTVSAPSDTPSPSPSLGAPIDAATPDPSTVAPSPGTSLPRTTYPGWVTSLARCVINHESVNAGLYKAENPISTASGAYQFLDRTWRTWTQRSGIGQRWRHAADAPPQIQDAVFAYAVMNGGKRDWHGTDCPGT